jgi:hypothetical protein
MPLKHADVLQKINDLWGGIGDGARLTLEIDGSNEKIVHPHGFSVSFPLSRGELELTIDQLAKNKLTQALTDLKEKVQ